jgi:iron complex outermembrane receptor protein
VANKFSLRLLTIVGTCGVLVASPRVVIAAEAAAEPQAGQASPAASTASGGSDEVGAGRLSEIVVTAQKRSENVQNVPIAITAITSEAIDKNRLATTMDIQYLTPSLVYANAAGFAEPYLRGIGSDTTGPNLDASVATYVDGVYISSTSGAISSLLGVDRVEVLAGPQGTLYGRNAVGGAINVYTLTPGKTFDAEVNATYGNYDQEQISGFVSGPVNDQLSVGAYFAYDRRQTFNTYTAGNNPDDLTEETRGGVRFKAVWTPTDYIKLTGSAEYTSDSGSEGAALRNIQPNALGYAFGAPVVIAPYTYSNDAEAVLRQMDQAYTLREEVDLGWATLLGISAYRDQNEPSATKDLDGTLAPLLAVADGREASIQFSQELQLLSPANSWVTWIGGLYFFREKTGYYPTGLSSGDLYPEPSENLTQAQVVTRSIAAFGQATIPLDFMLSGMRLTLGGRVTQDHKTFSGEDYTDAGIISQADSSGQIGPTVVYPDESHTWTKFTPKVTLDYKIGDTLLYATFSQGYKSGAYNIATPSAPGPVNPEELTAYEVGTKSEFLDGRLRLNTSAYYYDWTNVQVSSIDAVNGGTTILQNAASVRSEGLEAAVMARATNDLSFNGSISLEHSRYASFPNYASYTIGAAGNPSTAFDATGNDAERAPRMVFNLGAEYKYPLSNGGNVDGTAKWYHNSGFYWEPTDRFAQNAYSLVNVSLAYNLPGDKISVEGWSTNLTNQHYLTDLLVLPVSVVVQDGQPRMFGVSFHFRY